MEFVALRLHRGVTLSDGAARTLVGYARRRLGRERWDYIALELFAGAGGESLLIARPAAVRAVFADYALPALERALARKK